MNFWDNVMQKWNLLREKSAPATQAAGKVAKSAGNVLSTIWRYIKAFKKVWLTIPVVVGAIMLALHNLTHLPKVVGLNLQTDGVFALQIPRGTAVFAPLVITLICLLLMWCSRRTLTPWFACLVSLALPVVILIMNTFPG
jgi:hypothetical protein